jgi:prophage DNA circulation protein
MATRPPVASPSPSFLASLGQCTFDGLAIPYENISVSNTQRKHVHLYPHINKGKAEKLGVGLFSIQISALFDASIEREYENNFPGTLNELLRRFKNGVTGKLYLPTRGTILAFCDEWKVDTSPKVTSGERATFSFCEDDEESFSLKNDFVNFAPDFRAAALSFADLWALYEAEQTPAEKSIFSKIDDAVNKVRAGFDQAELHQTLIAAKLERLVSLCAEAEDKVTGMSKPGGFPLLEALKELWSTSKAMAIDVFTKDIQINDYFVPARMSITQVSWGIYGDATHVSDLLELNFFEDVMSIKAGTRVRYFAPAESEV